MRKNFLSFTFINTLFVLLLIFTPVQRVKAAEIAIPDNVIEYHNHSYMLYDKCMPWTEAEAYCESLGGHLVTISDENEQNFVANLIKEKSINYWLGAQIINGSWKWVTKEAFSYTNWDPGEPNGDNNNMYLQMYTRGVWDDTYNDNEKYSICEWDQLRKSLTLSHDSIFVYEGFSGSIQYTVTPSQAVTFTSDDSNIVKVDANGNLEGVSTGNAIITATAADGQTKDCLVTVMKEPSSVTLNKNKVTLRVRGKYTLVATVDPVEATDFETMTWFTSNKKIATISSKGVVTAKKKGSCTIIVKTSSGLRTSCKVIVK